MHPPFLNVTFPTNNTLHCKVLAEQVPIFSLQARPMNILRARAMGMCFGVRDALPATSTVPDPTEPTIYSDLVHNPAVSRELTERGFASPPESARADNSTPSPLPTTPHVLVTAHGLSHRDRDRL